MWMRSVREKVGGVLVVVAAVAIPLACPAPRPTHARQVAGNPDLVIIGGRVYRLVPYAGPDVPVPPDPIPGPATPSAVPPPASDLQKKARDYLYVIPAYHRQVAREARKGLLKTNADVGKRGIQLRDAVGGPFGDAVNEAIARSKSLDANGNIVDVDAYAKIFESIADAQSQILKQVNP
jgi:hypothetical protein